MKIMPFGKVCAPAIWQRRSCLLRDGPTVSVRAIGVIAIARARARARAALKLGQTHGSPSTPFSYTQRHDEVMGECERHGGWRRKRICGEIRGAHRWLSLLP
jgi:hypothetical protein